jgi:hypothetical protein
MPKLNSNTLDDPIQTDACPGFAGGQCSSGPPDQLAATEAAELLNVDIRDGTATTRRGTVTLGERLGSRIQGLCWYDTHDVEYLVACSGGHLFRWDEHSWESFSTFAGADADAAVSFAQLDDVLYIADGATPLSAWDGTALTEVSAPAGALLMSSSNRLWMAGISEATDTLCASKVLDGSAWDDTNLRLRIGAGEGDPITGLAEWDDHQIVVFKRNSIYIVRADPAKTSGDDAATSLAHAEVTKISDTIGCVAHRSIARVGSDLWFLSDGGVFSIGRVLAQATRELKEAVSGPVQDIIQRINWSATHTAAAVVWDHRYLLSLPLDGAVTPTAILVYHAQRKAWSGWWTGVDAIDWALSKAAGHARLNFGRADGSVRRWLDYTARANEVESTFQDAGVNIPTRITTRAMNLGEAVCEKSGLSVQAEFFESQAMAKVAVRLNEDEAIPLGSDFATSLGTLVLPVLLPATLPGLGVKRKAFGTQRLTPFRSLQTVVSSPAGKLSLRAVFATGFVDTVRLEE